EALDRVPHAGEWRDVALEAVVRLPRDGTHVGVVDVGVDVRARVSKIMPFSLVGTAYAVLAEEALAGAYTTRTSRRAFTDLEVAGSADEPHSGRGVGRPAGTYVDVA